MVEGSIALTSMGSGPSPHANEVIVPALEKKKRERKITTLAAGAISTEGAAAKINASMSAILYGDTVTRAAYGMKTHTKGNRRTRLTSAFLTGSTCKAEGDTVSQQGTVAQKRLSITRNEVTAQEVMSTITLTLTLALTLTLTPALSLTLIQTLTLTLTLKFEGQFSESDACHVFL